MTVIFHLEVSMHDAVLMQEADGFQNLLDHPAGVLLWINAAVQNTVEQLTARNPETENPHR